MTLSSNPREVLEAYLKTLYQEFDYAKAYQYFSKTDQEMASRTDYIAEMENTFWAAANETPIFYEILALSIMERTALAEVQLKYNNSQAHHTLQLTLIKEIDTGQWAVSYNWDDDQRRKRIAPTPR